MDTYLEFGSAEERDEFMQQHEALVAKVEAMELSQTILVAILTGQMTPEEATAQYGTTAAGQVLALVGAMKAQIETITQE